MPSDYPMKCDFCGDEYWNYSDKINAVKGSNKVICEECALKKKKVVYVAGPYRSKKGEYFVGENIRRAREVALKYWAKKDTVVICPHMNTKGMGGFIPNRQIMDGYLELVKRSDIIVMLKEWEDSPGACEEHECALINNIEVIYEE